MNEQEEKEYCIAFALSCQIPTFLRLPGDIQRGLVDLMMRMGCEDFSCMYVLRSQIEAGNLDAVKALLVQLNK